ncbi:KilA-N domain-containing protein [Halomonas sp. 18H]|nr:KilA-N domain-containing protein [Halomonas sp. 18H]MCW4151906.1 KilA-N domain-containing protein [Halomonas sp. 18H]
MSSRQIAEVVEKRHDSVKRTIEMLIRCGAVTSPQSVETSFLDTRGRKQWTAEYRVNQRDSYVIVAQLSPEFTARLVDRWQELEQQVAQPKDIAVRQDREGRFNLNDLHKAAGGVKHHQPGKFLFNQSTQDLISEIGEYAVHSKRGRYGGTFVVKELVYAYAMWISPAFHLKVIRAYDAMVTQPQPHRRSDRTASPLPPCPASAP